jgi:hypothetical protein
MLLCLAPVCMLLDEAANYVVALLGGRCLVFLGNPVIVGSFFFFGVSPILRFFTLG